MREYVQSQINQKSNDIAAMTHKQAEESARAITLDITQRVNTTESELT